MKYFFLAAILSGSVFAQNITGVAVLKGSLKTKTLVNDQSATCKVKVDKIRNIKEEDAYGFPGYKVTVEASLEGRNEKSELSVRMDQQFTLTNFWNVNGMTVAKDLDYFSVDGAFLKIKPDGRLASFSFPYQNQKITCAF